MERIPEEVRHNLTLNLQPVWQTVKTDNIGTDELIGMMNLFKSAGITPTLKPIGLCYVDMKHFDCIYPDGTVGKCNNDSNEIKPGILQNGGEVDFSDAHTTHFQPTYEMSDSECAECNYLPICWGPTKAV
ncbi:MAG: SPASM domain-containing protein [Prevotella sp.]|nr:SPASM domain-containing protein [Prevotella sp.]MCM1075400.1 SPASM domain-containing protein [Ruminococcus sp.]